MTILELGTKFKKIFGFNPSIDMLMTSIRGPEKAVIDIIKLDSEFGARDSEYLPEKCTYKGKKGYSLSGYITEKYGEEAAQFIRDNI